MKKIISAIVILSVLFFFTKNIVAKIVISAGVEVITGLRLDIKNVDIGILKTSIDAQGVRIFNPPEFEDRLMADVPEIYIDYNMVDFLRKKVHLEELRLNIKELVVVRNEEGGMNLDSLKAMNKKQDTSVKEKKNMPRLQIDILELKIEKVIYKDYSAGRLPKVREYNVNIKKRYENISDPKSLVGLLSFKALVSAGVSDITSLDVVSLGKGIGDTLGVTSKAAGKTAGKTMMTTGGAVKQVTEKAVNIIKKILP